MITSKELIADVFDIFHDGSIILHKESKTYHIWKIECLYLAELVNEKFDSFYIKIHKPRLIEFEPWFTSSDSPDETWKTSKKIFQAELDIGNTKIINDIIEIYCNQFDKDFNYSGGTLKLDCEAIEITDEKGANLGHSELAKLCNSYWNEKKC